MGIFRGLAVDAGAKLSERDICTKFITPALVLAGWDVQTQIREEVGFTKGRIIVRGRLVTRGKAKRADYILYYKHLPLALIEAKDGGHAVGDGMQQALDYAETLDIPYGMWGIFGRCCCRSHPSPSKSASSLKSTN